MRRRWKSKRSSLLWYLWVIRGPWCRQCWHVSKPQQPYQIVTYDEGRSGSIRYIFWSEVNKTRVGKTNPRTSNPLPPLDERCMVVWCFPYHKENFWRDYTLSLCWRDDIRGDQIASLRDVLRSVTHCGLPNGGSLSHLSERPSLGPCIMRNEPF